MSKATAEDTRADADRCLICMQLLGVWCVSVWQQLGSPKALHLAELGPGRGTLMKDLLRSTAVFPAFSAAPQHAPHRGVPRPAHLHRQTRWSSDRAAASKQQG